MTPLRMDIWSDIACPWCYVGKRRLEAALAQFEQNERIQLVWRSFELDPSASHERQAGAYAERLARKYGSSRVEAEAMISRIVDVGRSEGIAFDFERTRPTNTFHAHRLLHLAKSQGLQNAMKERLLAAYFVEGKAIGDRDTLVQLASGIGLAADLVDATLRGDAFAQDVRLDEREAEAIGVRGVPFFVLGGRYAVSGAQPAAVLCDAMRQALENPKASEIEHV